MIVWLQATTLHLVFPDTSITYSNPHLSHSSSQEDDIEGTHIVAFAEEEDPGNNMCYDTIF